MTKWNTGRTYTEHGQRIAACEVEEGAYFVDIDRGISGFVVGPIHEGWLQYAVMGDYDSGTYKRHLPSGDFDKQTTLREKLTAFAQ